MTSSTDLTGRKAVVTGGTHGMGLAIAAALADGGAEVLVTGRGEKTLASARERLGPRAHTVRSDVSRMADVDALAEAVRDTLGHVDHLFVNAGTAVLEPFTDVTEATYDTQFAVNTKGAFFTVQRLAPLLRDGGSIVFTGSVAEDGGSPGMSVYAASKAALLSLTRSLASELLPRGIRVNLVSPGFIDTPSMGVPGMTDAEKAAFRETGDAVSPMRRHGTAEEVARAALHLAVEATYTTGARLPVDGGLGQGVQHPS